MKKQEIETFINQLDKNDIMIVLHSSNGIHVGMRPRLVEFTHSERNYTCLKFDNPIEDDLHLLVIDYIDHVKSMSFLTLSQVFFDVFQFSKYFLQQKLFKWDI
jgi:hypothetical protein